MVYHKAVIKGITTDVTNEEIWMELKESNPTLVFDTEDIFRLKTRSFIDGTVNYINSTSVRLNLRAATVPSHVFMWRTRMTMTPYIPGIRQCFNCGQLNHATKFCKNNAKCLTCSLDSHQGDSICSNKMCCINCGGNHRSLAKDCPEVIIKKRTTALMASQNIDFNTAKKTDNTRLACHSKKIRQ